jgi:hypothetical protein
MSDYFKHVNKTNSSEIKNHILSFQSFT